MDPNLFFQRPKQSDSEESITKHQIAFEKLKGKKDFQPAAKAIRSKNRPKESVFAQKRANREGNGQKKEDPHPYKVLMKEVEAKNGSQSTGSSSNTAIPSDFTPSNPPQTLQYDDKSIKEAKKSGKSLFALSLEKGKSLGNGGVSSSSGNENSYTNRLYYTGLPIELQMLPTTNEERLYENRKVLSCIASVANILKGDGSRQDSWYKTHIAKEEENNPNKNSEAPACVKEILIQNLNENWINFDKVELDKFKWMKTMPVSDKIQPGDQFQARFDFHGILLPYDAPTTIDDRELYSHGDEPSRAGYTLQELFRLARSKMISQRGPAIRAIAGILNIYNQGFYDDVLDLPISKMFFLLRFNFDFNLEITLLDTSRGLSNLFYNETDETVLDLIYEIPDGHLQPSLQLVSDEDSESIEDKMSKLSLKNKPFSAKVRRIDAEFDKSSMNDFQLAETDLIDCLIRSNIVQRIGYIFETIKPQQLTVNFCLQILIRIARTGFESAQKILDNDYLMSAIFKYFLPELTPSRKAHTYFYPQYLALKLCRVMMSNHLYLCEKLRERKLLERVKEYLSYQEDIDKEFIKVQVECMRIVRVTMTLIPDHGFYRSLLPVFQYYLSWHFKHLIYGKRGPMLIKQHAAALLNAISSGGVTLETKPDFEKLLIQCFNKWLDAAANSKLMEISQSILLGAILNCIQEFNKNKWNPNFCECVYSYLKRYIKSDNFYESISKLQETSVLLNTAEDRRNLLPALPNLGSVLKSNSSPKLILSQCYPVYVLKTLLKFSEIDKSKSWTESITNQLLEPHIVDKLLEYLKAISSINLDRSIATNFFAKQEITLLIKLLSLKELFKDTSHKQTLRIALRAVGFSTAEHVDQIDKLFNEIIFNSTILNSDQSKLNESKKVYLDSLVKPHQIVISPENLNLTLPAFASTVLPKDWPYALLKNILDKYLRRENGGVEAVEVPHRDLIRITFNFIELLEIKQIYVTSFTEKLIYLMIAFMGQDDEFLKPDINALLKKHVKKFFEQARSKKLELEKEFDGKCKFENLYVLFLDHFQGASFGDDTFASLVMVPLAQKYDAKWRKMVWSEHAVALRFIGITDDQLLGGLHSYLTPAEKDESLIKSYAQVLNSDLLRENTAPHQIATRHLKMFKQSFRVPDNIKNE